LIFWYPNYTRDAKAASFRKARRDHGQIETVQLAKLQFQVGQQFGMLLEEIFRIFPALAEPFSIERIPGPRLVNQVRIDSQIETNIDDMNPEFYNYTLEKLFALGALDVTIIPVQMKKNRPGVLLRVLVEPVLEQATADLLFTETTTLGIRVQDVKRIEVPREARVVSTRFGPCKVKRVVLPNGSERMIPEYEECRRIARERGIPIPDVYRNLLTEAN